MSKKIDISIALVGNPTSGLTTLFNRMTNGIEHSGRFSTARHKTKEGPVRDHPGINVIELPGLYSLSAYSPEDLATRSILLDGKPDVIVNIVDSTSIERSLYLTLQLLELNTPMVLALNMIDEMRGNGDTLDLEKLKETLSIPIVPISAVKNEGIHDLIHVALKTATEKRLPEKQDFCSGHVHTAIHSIAHLIEPDALREGLPLRFCATRLVEGDRPIAERLKIQEPDFKIIEHIVEDMEHHLDTDREAAMADMRYAYIEQLCSRVIWKSGKRKEQLRSLKIDSILTHRIFAIPIFLLIMFLIFWLTFEVIGAWLSSFLDLVITGLIGELDALLTAGNVAAPIHSLLIDGVCAGVGSVLSFLPIIGVLFFFLSILEDSGYIPRVAFVMDTLLRPLGLSGRSIVPMLIGFGCSVPAIMATRTLPSTRDRYLTILLIPFMSCSAKLPIYAMFTAAFFTDCKALALIGIYLTGIVVSVLCALLLKTVVFNGNPVPFVMVLPSYRLPAMKSVWLRMWANIKGFIKKAFTVIFIATIVIWLLQSFDSSFNMVESPENSILAAIGKAAAPIFAPLGFGDWRAATALITGLSAKEAVVSTLAVLMGATEGGMSMMLTSIFTPLTAFCFLVFCLLYMPCIATLATIRREMGGLHYALGVVCFQTCVAWIVSFLIYHIGLLFL